MSTFIHSFSSRHVICVDHTKFHTVGDLKIYLSVQKGVPIDACFLVCNGNTVDDAEPVKKDVVYHTYLRLPGGKGGFGSMLRAIGAQIEKTTNHEACRDLSGRRMRDVNNEKDLKDWLGKQAEREREREQKRQERIARRRAMPNHKFDDPDYDKQRILLQENQEDALQTGLKKVLSKPGSSATVTSEEMLSVKRKADSQGASGSGISKKKKDTEWLGVDIDNLSDMESDEDTSSSDDTAQRGTTSVENKNNSGECESNIDVAESKNSNNSEGTQNSQKDESKHSLKCNEMASNAEETLGNYEIEQNENSEKHRNTEETCGACDEAQEDKPFHLDDVISVQDLVQLGLDRLKEELMQRGLKCGGTLEQRAERLFSIKGLTKDQIDPSLFTKSANGKKVKKTK